jgi:hypothetical protein
LWPDCVNKTTGSFTYLSRNTSVTTATKSTLPREAMVSPLHHCFLRTNAFSRFHQWMLMSEPFGWSISTSPLSEELLGEELQGRTPPHDVCSSSMHLQEVNTIVLFVINLCADDVIAVLMGVIFLVGTQRRLETGAAAMQNAIASIEDLIDRTSAMGQESLGVTHQE